MSVESEIKSWDSLSPEVQAELREIYDGKVKPGGLPPIDRYPFGGLIIAYEVLEHGTDRMRKDTETAMRSAAPDLALEIIVHTSKRIDNWKQDMLAKLGGWPAKFQGIADRDYDGAQLDARVLRSMRGRICREHPGMTPDEVNDLRLPIAFEILSQGTPKTPEPTNVARDDDSRWPTRADAARISGANPGVVTKAVQSGELTTNGESGRALRIEPLSLTNWTARRAQRPESRESDAAVLAKFKKTTR
jgi:hypothetical protein